MKTNLVAYVYRLELPEGIDRSEFLERLDKIEYVTILNESTFTADIMIQAGKSISLIFADIARIAQ